MNTAIIYTDGSCDKNPGGNGGWACIIIYAKKLIKLCGFEPETTNQRMEMQAVYEAMQYFKESTRMIINTDSAYVCNCIKQKWYEKWKSNGWKNSNKQNIANKDLWEKIIPYLTLHDISMCKVKGHSNNILNNECDNEAKGIIAYRKHLKNKYDI